MEGLISQVLQWLTDLGYAGIAIGLMLEVIPSEIVLSYGGYMVSQGKINFVGAVIAGTIGGTIAQHFLYWIGRYGGRPFLEKYGKYLLINKKHLDIAEQWFARYGTGVIFTARFIPVVRHAISIPAGIAGMSFARFTLYTVLAIIPWSIFFLYLGMELDSKWDKVKEIAAPYVNQAAIVAAILIVGYFLFKELKKQHKQQN
ncbi:DedA family protein [Polycladomyces subterraneus]|uniref:DedA family protein n=1 Tax=Polycladomyces subterraneus TaxID=1016997 RepID=A0ABT8ILC8_9BACL|nr:DedA family protein [Polycladomyces subterraneus]MDN4592994.1 DedA family protein [Polycladomyces subterraneus]